MGTIRSLPPLAAVMLMYPSARFTSARSMLANSETLSPESSMRSRIVRLRYPLPLDFWQTSISLPKCSVAKVAITLVGALGTGIFVMGLAVT